MSVAEKIKQLVEQYKASYENAHAFNKTFKYNVYCDFKEVLKILSVEHEKLQDFLAFLYSQAPLFCTHGKNELDCMKSTSPCKRKHRKECPVYLRIEKFVLLFDT